MSWGVQITTDIFVPRVRKEELESKIQENEDLIAMHEKELSMLISASPREVVSEDARTDGSVIEELRIKLNEILESYRECIRENCLMQIVLEEIDKAENC